jgi:hypothetical protein
MSDFTEHIYKLTDPRDESIRYVGRTSDIQARYYAHLAAKSQKEKDIWIRELHDLGLKPIMTVIETVRYSIPADAYTVSPSDRETFWIRWLIEQGQPLFNKMQREQKQNIIFDRYGNKPLEIEVAQLRDENKRLREIIQKVTHLLNSENIPA